MRGVCENPIISQKPAGWGRLQPRPGSRPVGDRASVVGFKGGAGHSRADDLIDRGSRERDFPNPRGRLGDRMDSRGRDPSRFLRGIGFPTCFIPAFCAHSDPQ